MSRQAADRRLARVGLTAFGISLSACNAGCEKERSAGAATEDHEPAATVPSAAGVDAPQGRRSACGPRGLPPDRHFVAEGLCVRVVAHEQGPLRGITFAPNGDLFAVTAEGELRRYRDVDHDGLYAEGPPETVAWAHPGSETQNCELDGQDLYCGSRSGVRRWRYAPEIDQGGAGEDVVVGMPEGAAHSARRVALRDGVLYAISETSRRFTLGRSAPGKPFAWRSGEPTTADLPPVALPSPRGPFALGDRWREGAFMVLPGSTDGVRETPRHQVIWISSADASAGTPEIVFGGGKYGAPRDGEWSWRLGEAGEDPVRPAGVAISPLDGALYVSSGNDSKRSGAIYRIALLGK